MTIAVLEAFETGIISHPATPGVTTSYSLGSTAGMMLGMQVLEPGLCYMGINLGG